MKLSDYLLPLFAALTLMLFSALPYDSMLVERWYSHGVFVVYRWCWEWLTGWLPVPVIYIVLVSSFLFLVYHGRLGWRRLLWSIVQLISVFVITFYWLWGFNYKRYDVFAQLSGGKSIFEQELLFEELELVTDSMTVIRNRISSDSVIDWSTQPIDPERYSQILRQSLIDMGQQPPSTVVVRRLYPRGSLLHWSTAGVYLPWAGEGHIDPGLHPITWPSTMTHELAHGYGYTSESVCNFLALITCVNSDDDFVRYSGYFGYWRYLRSNAYRSDSERYMEYQKSLPVGIKQDIIEVHQYADRYPDIMPAIRDLFYDRYLRSHGVSAGLQSYSQVILLAHGWRQRYGSLTLQKIE